MIKDYCVVESDNTYDFESKVRDLILNGWHPVGSLAVYHHPSKSGASGVEKPGYTLLREMVKEEKELKDIAPFIDEMKTAHQIARYVTMEVVAQLDHMLSVDEKIALYSNVFAALLQSKYRPGQ